MDEKTFPPSDNPTLPPVVMPACPIDRKLKGQKALVTGASSGIGRGIAKAYAHRADVSKEDEVRNMFARMEAEFGGIDILVANAGLHGRDDARAMERRDGGQSHRPSCARAKRCAFSNGWA